MNNTFCAESSPLKINIQPEFSNDSFSTYQLKEDQTENKSFVKDEEETYDTLSENTVQN